MFETQAVYVGRDKYYSDKSKKTYHSVMLVMPETESHQQIDCTDEVYRSLDGVRHGSDVRVEFVLVPGWQQRCRVEVRHVE